MLICLFLSVYQLIKRSSIRLDYAWYNVMFDLIKSIGGIIVLIAILIISMGCMGYYYAKHTKKSDEHIRDGLFGVIILLILSCLGYGALDNLINSSVATFFYIGGIIIFLVIGTIVMIRIEDCDNILEGIMMFIGYETNCIVWTIIGIILMALVVLSLGLILLILL